MALTGHLSDLSLSELIEFFCNQRKTGCLSVRYPKGAGHFYLQTGSVIDAQLGELQGIDAVYYALALPNSAFEFSGAAELPERTINQPWTQVVLEGLRRLDEGIMPAEAFPVDWDQEQPRVQSEPSVQTESSLQTEDSHHEEPVVPEPVMPEPTLRAEPLAPASPPAYETPKRALRIPSFMTAVHVSSSPFRGRKSLIAGAAAFAILASVAVVGVPAGWYGRKGTTVANQQTVSTNATASTVSPDANSASQSASDAHANDAKEAAARKQKERERAERAKAREQKANAAADATTETPSATLSQTAEAAKSEPKRVTVQVTYDETGRVVQASGTDATAIRIARQKHFPPGKAGTTAVTITLN